jgi:hypothetical protein
MSAAQSTTSNITVFLGAGASVPFGIPDTVKIVENLEKDLKCYADRIHGIRENVRKFGFLDDIEAVLAVADFWANPKDAILEIGPSFAEATNLAPACFKKRLREARMSQRIKDYIVRKCFISEEEIITNIMSIYGQFFQSLAQTFNLPYCDPKGRLECPAIDVFTTNYDNVIELYAKRNGVRIYDGYREQVTGYYVFEPEYYETSVAALRLYKLHGTVTYAKLDSGEVERLTLIPKKGPLVIAGRKAFPDLIYPGMHRYLAREPQLELLNLLKKKLLFCRICIVVGYSFRDPNIRQLFTDVCRKNNSLKIYLISPHADRIIKEKNLDTSRFIPVKKRFEKLDVRNDLGETL